MDIPPQDVERKGRLMPGNILLVDFDAHSLIDDEEVRACSLRPMRAGAAVGGATAG